MAKFYCSICRKALPEGAEDGKLFPFCSQRCRMVDLGKWMTDEYVIEGGSQDEEEDELPER